jgi:aconitate hydratase 2/2-methylisocitrate dehydratase
MLESYFKHVEERRALGIPPLPLSPEQVAEVCQNLENPPQDKKEVLLHLIRDRVSPGVDPAAEVKAAWLAKVARGEAKSPIISGEEAVGLLGTMLGGYNVGPLVSFLEDRVLAATGAEALKYIILVYGHFDTVAALAKKNSQAKAVLESWAKAEWFLARTPLPETVTL